MLAVIAAIIFFLSPFIHKFLFWPLITIGLILVALHLCFELPLRGWRRRRP